MKTPLTPKTKVPTKTKVPPKSTSQPVMSASCKLVQKLKASGIHSEPISNPPFTFEEAVIMLVELARNRGLGPEMAARVPALLHLYRTLGELACQLAKIPKRYQRRKLDKIPEPISKTMSKALGELLRVTERDIIAIHSLRDDLLKQYAIMMPEFPFLITGHPSWKTRVDRKVKAILLGASIPGGIPISRIKNDDFTTEANKIYWMLMLTGMNLDPANWPSIRKHVREDVFAQRFSKDSKLLIRLRRQIKCSSDKDKQKSGHFGRVDSRVKERILERLASRLGINKI